MAKPFTFNLTGARAIFKGQTLRETVSWATRASESDDPVAVNLTGCTARAQFRANVNATGEPLLELTTEDGGIVLGGVAGTVQLVITAAETAAITWATAVFDCEIVLANGDVRRLLQGDVEVDPEVTR